MNRVIHRLALIFLLACSSAFVASAISVDPSEALRTKDYGALVRLYQGEIDDSATPTSTMYYNLGLAYSLMGNRAESIRHYDMALYLEPTHREARHNLNVLYDQAPNGVDDGRALLSTLFDPLCYFFSIGGWAILALICFFLLVVSIGVFLIARDIQYRRRGFYSAVVFFFVTILCNASIAHQVYYRSSLTTKLVVRDVCSAYAKDTSEALVLATLAPLSTLKYISDQGEWIQVGLPDGQVAWVHSSDVAKPLMN